MLTVLHEYRYALHDVLAARPGRKSTKQRCEK